MKKALSIVMVGVMFIGLLVGCQSNPASSDNAHTQTREEILTKTYRTHVIMEYVKSIDRPVCVAVGDKI